MVYIFSECVNSSLYTIYIKIHTGTGDSILEFENNLNPQYQTCTRTILVESDISGLSSLLFKRWSYDCFIVHASLSMK